MSIDVENPGERAHFMEQLKTSMSTLLANADKLSLDDLQKALDLIQGLNSQDSSITTVASVQESKKEDGSENLENLEPSEILELVKTQWNQSVELMHNLRAENPAFAADMKKQADQLFLQLVEEDLNPRASDRQLIQKSLERLQEWSERPEAEKNEEQGARSLLGSSMIDGVGVLFRDAEIVRAYLVSDVTNLHKDQWKQVHAELQKICRTVRAYAKKYEIEIPEVKLLDVDFAYGNLVTMEYGYVHAIPDAEQGKKMIGEYKQKAVSDPKKYSEMVDGQPDFKPAVFEIISFPFRFKGKLIIKGRVQPDGYLPEGFVPQRV